MNQEVFAGIIMCLIGICLLIVSPYKIWSITDKWKTIGGKGPSKSFIITTRVLGFIFAVAGGYLLIFGL